MGAEAGIEIRFLGQPLVADAGEPVKLARRATTLTMLALLILRRDRPVSRTYLAFTLFPDLSDEQALSELRRYLFHLSKALTPRGSEPYLIVDSETVRWNDRSDAFVDILAFERMAQDPQTHEEAVDLYGGDLLEDIYDDWVVAERERLRSMLFGMLEGLIERFRRARMFPKALAYANRLLVADPWREDVVRRVMSIRYASGDATGALATFDRFAKQLRDDMGVDPMAETVALRETILLDRPLIDSVDHPRGDAPAVGRPRASTNAFIGRTNELAHLHALWDRAARGFGNIVFLGGEAGVGKTALVGEFARIVDTEGGRVLFGETSSPESSSYQCVAEALRPTLPMLGTDKSHNLTISVLARVFPEWQEQARTLPDIGALPAAREVTRLLSAFASAVLELGTVRPLILVLEDLHWASSSTLDAVAAICRRLQRARVIIVGTYRDDEVAADHPLRKLMNELRNEGRMTVTHLARFDRDDIERIIRAHPAFKDVDAGVAERFATFSEGNALFLTQALAYTAERRQSGTTIAEHRAIDHIIAARLARLSDAAQTVAEITAVCGPGCNVDIVQDVAGLPMSDVLTAFDELLDRRLIREAGARERFDFVFTHNLIRSAVYAQISDGGRTRRHARIAHVLEKRGDLTPSEARDLAGHYDLAGNGEKASTWFVRAAINAQRLYAHDDVVTFASRAIESGTHDRGAANS
jgi:DNA-binding SARP family transcriptional activator